MKSALDLLIDFSCVLLIDVSCVFLDSGNGFAKVREYVEMFSSNGGCCRSICSLRFLFGVVNRSENLASWGIRSNVHALGFLALSNFH